MTKRKIIITSIATLLIFLLGMMAFKILQNQKQSTLSSRPVKNELRSIKVSQLSAFSANNPITIDGRLQAFEQIELSAKVTGVLESTNKLFKKGSYFKKGELIFNIDNRETRYNLLAQRSNLLNAISQMMPDLKFDYADAFDKWFIYVNEFDVEKTTLPMPKVDSDQEKYFVASKNILNIYYNIKSLESRLSDFKIYAPFSGVITNANVYPGSLITPGTPLGTMINSSKYELEAPVRLSELNYIKVGQKVDLYSSALDKSYQGRVSRIGNQIDPTTQYIPIYIALNSGALKEGMYLTGQIDGKSLDNVVALNKDFMPDQSSIFVVVDSTIMRKNINIVSQNDEKVYTRDIDADAVVVTDVITSLFEGQKVITIPSTQMN